MNKCSSSIDVISFSKFGEMGQKIDFNGTYIVFAGNCIILTINKKKVEWIEKDTQ